MLYLLRKLIAGVVNQIFFVPSIAVLQENGSSYNMFFVKSGLLKTLYFVMNLSSLRIGLQANRSRFLSIWDRLVEHYCDLIETTRVVEGNLLIDKFGDVLSR